MEGYIMKVGLAISVLVAGILTAALSVWGAEEEKAALAKALTEASVPLDRGLKSSEREGKPISGKYELEKGALQLSVYTEKGPYSFKEVIVDHKSGNVKKAETITDADDLKHAREQSAAMAAATVSLDKAVASAVAANSGYRAVSAVPTLKGGEPIADITLMKGEETKEVTEKLK
jgi:hypothetical protein